MRAEPEPEYGAGGPGPSFRSTGNILGDLIQNKELRTMLRGIEVAPSDSQIDELLALAALVERWGERINLTGHRGLEGILQGLVVESVALCGALPEVESLVDLGSGAGFPGLPIAILRPECHVRLVDSRRRRHHFQREATRALGLDNVDLVLGRAEEVQARA